MEDYLFISSFQPVFQGSPFPVSRLPAGLSLRQGTPGESSCRSSAGQSHADVFTVLPCGESGGGGAIHTTVVHYFFFLHYMSLADAFVQSDLQLIRLSRRYTPWSNVGLRALLKGSAAVWILLRPHQGSNHRPCGSKSSSLTATLQAAHHHHAFSHIPDLHRGKMSQLIA